VAPLLTPFIILVIFSWTKNTFLPPAEIRQKIDPLWRDRMQETVLLLLLFPLSSVIILIEKHDAHIFSHTVSGTYSIFQTVSCTQKQLL
jgi:hypothetical protein